MMSKLVSASAIVALLGTSAGCSVGGSPKARTSTLVVSGVGFAAGTGMVAAAYRTDDHPAALFWSGIGLAVASAVVLSATAGTSAPAGEVAPAPAAPITGTVRAPGLAPIVLR